MKPENVEFFALIEAAGWSQAEAARQLDLDPSVISQYKSDAVKPSSQTLNLLKLILWRDRPGALTAAGEAREQALADWERKVIEDLRWLHKEDRAKVIAVMRSIVEALPRREPITYGPPAKEPLQGVSSEVAGVAQGTAADALRAARNVPPERTRSHGADGPNVRKRGRVGGAGPGKGRKPGLPGKAQG